MGLNLGSFNPTTWIANPFAGQIQTGGSLASSLVPQVPDPSAEMRAQEEERRARVAASQSAINGEFAKFDDPYFKSIADSWMKFQQPLFSEQAAEARRTLPFGFASTSSSAYLRKKGELERDIARENAGLGDKALDFSNQQRGAVEQNRADLVGLSTGGTDAGSIAQMANTRAQALARPAPFTPIADLFQKYTALGANAALARQPAGSFDSPLLFRPSGAGFGAPARGSVREVA